MTGRFEPIAVVGQGCVLPGALTPTALWENVVAGQTSIREVPDGRWSVDPELVRGTRDNSEDATWSTAGGYVEGFDDVFDPQGFLLPAGQLAGLDPLVHWVLHAGREAMRDAGLELGERRAGLVLGNLSFPTPSMAELSESIFLQRHGQRLGLKAPPETDARNRFMSGLPAHLAARALGLDAPAFCLDAACASSLYAIRIAADALRDGRADVMLAGAVNRADTLFLHLGFCALRALSESGQSRPFHRDADGLLPSEGAGVVALMRLADARRDGRRVLGVIRGVGLSNDGRGRNLLAPSSDGQVRAMHAAYEMAGLRPADISLVECHATGTPVGDAIELQSMRRVFGDERELAIGSLKSNLGHLITTAGVAGLMKVLGSLAYRRRPPTLFCDEPNPALDGSRLRPVTEAEPWDSDGARRAAVSAFGFGGNNAHLIVEEHDDSDVTLAPPPPVAPRVDRRIAIVGIGVRLGDARGPQVLVDALLAGDASKLPPAGDNVVADTSGLRFPPRDLQQAIPQQLLALEAARDAAASAGELDSERTGVLVGMGCDVDVTTPGLRWRAAQWAKDLGAAGPEAERWLRDTRAALAPAPGAQAVLGQMPNIPANRLNVQLDLRGLGFTVSAEELSGIAALRCATTWLLDGELDTAIVAAVDTTEDERHQVAAQRVARRPLTEPTRAAVALRLRRLDDARRDGDAILAILGDQAGDPDLEIVARGLDDSARDDSALDDPAPDDDAQATELAALVGETHAASGLLGVATAAVALATGTHPRGKPWGDERERRAVVRCSALGRAQDTVHVVALGATLDMAEFGPRAVEAARQISMPAVRVFQDLDPLVSSGTGSDVQPMPRAPTLPSVRSAPEAPLSTPHAVDPTFLEPQNHAPSTSPAPRAPAAQGPAGVRALAEARVDLARAHTAFLEAAGDAHAAFLQARSSRWEKLSAMLRAQRANAPVMAVVRPTDAPSLDRASATTQATPIARTTTATATTTARTAAPAARTTTTDTRVAEKPLFDRHDLERLASAKISEVLGPLFARQDDFPRQVRMPEPPLLLADRVLRIDAEPGVLAAGGTIFTETDVTWDSWYLHHDRVTPGVLIEAGQADLLLISWMGVDFENRGERVYRLLGCDLTYSGPMPRVGSTLHYDIHIDGFATHGEVRIFFFHSDARLGGPDGPIVLSVREGQAGFFTDDELAGSGGVLWKPSDVVEDLSSLPLAQPRVVTTRKTLDREQLQRWADGDAYACFGEGFEATQPHVRTPAIQGGDMLLVDRVTEIAPRGGPWGRGYLRAELDFTPDRWFFDGHFKDDPCMPGTLMFEGCLQTMAIHLAAQGFTLDRDGSRFEPAHDETFKLRCRGQATPTSKRMVYEVFVKALHDGPAPRLVADLLVTVDGLKSLHCADVELALVIDHPLYSRPELLGDVEKTSGADAVGGVGRGVDTVAFDQTSLLATAWGRPSDAFGDLYKEFDGPRRIARLPGPPYHFMSRVSSIDGPPAGAMVPGGTVVVDYDVPSDAWFFDANGAPTMPFAVLLEVSLQPCGWLSCYVGSMKGDDDLYYRNLDGEGRVHREVGRDVGTLSTRTTMTASSRSGGMIIQSFAFETSDEHGLVFDGTTTFGFFPHEALARQVGVGATDADRARLVEPCPALPDGTPLPLDLGRRPDRLFAGSARLAGEGLVMIDRLSSLVPDGGSRGLGYARANKDVDASEWFFKAHFFQDPVQPGSLGVEAMLQTMQVFALETGLCDELSRPVFEPIASGESLSWKYRGQVVPTRERIDIEIDVLDVRRDSAGRTVELEAQGYLWCDGLRIYHAPRLVIRARDAV